ncbi:hypothetical protein GLW08_10040 [Pontibacillus yanchengensis]|uniref:Uncharacterized protein n=2 Tax=Pontibacillus yanchengensis TaxID=462910 RepID=A0ACC7VFI5_9BACI|nr:hypothetical protein [Pontibacillus yanchengensis]MYL53676.1 hypothetical protein [Pontibacillus yanchengensis]
MGASMFIEGQEVWKKFHELNLRDELFHSIGEGVEQNHEINQGFVGSASSKLMSMQELVDYAVTWLNQYDQQS